MISLFHYIYFCITIFKKTCDLKEHMTNKKEVIGEGVTLNATLFGSCSYPSFLSSFFSPLHYPFIFSISDCLFGKRNRTTRWNLSTSYFQLTNWRDFGNVVSCGVREGVKAGYSKTTRHFVSPLQMHYLQCEVKKVLGYKPN